MPSIFVSYRRTDSAGYAGRLYDHLSEAFGEKDIFIDIDSIRAGTDFLHAITETLDKSDAVLVVIGRGWFSVDPQSGARRIDKPDDPVRLEVGMALSAGRLVIPVLFDGVAMPSDNDLPDPLKGLTRLHAVTVAHQSFKGDVQRLVTMLRGGILAAKRDKTIASTWFIEGGVDVKQTRFRFTNFFGQGQEFILTGTNFGDQMGDRGTPPSLLHQLVVRTLKRSRETSIYLIVAPFELLEKMIPNSIADLQGRSAARLKMLQHDPRLTPAERSRLHIFDHRGATFLSVALRDPNSGTAQSGLAVVTTRWFKDEAGPQRMFFAVEETTAPEIFKAFILPIYPSIKIEEASLARQHDRTLGGRNIDRICTELGVNEDDPFLSELAGHPL